MCRSPGAELGREDPNWGEITGDMAMLEWFVEGSMANRQDRVEEVLLDDQHKQALTLQPDMQRPSTHYQQALSVVCLLTDPFTRLIHPSAPTGQCQVVLASVTTCTHAGILMDSLPSG